MAHIVSSPSGNTAMAIVRRLGLHNTISAIFSNFSIIFYFDLRFSLIFFIFGILLVNV